MKIKAPVTVHDGTRYVAPGTEIDLPEDEALNVIDEKSLTDLNFQASVNGGHGRQAPTLNQRANTVTGDAARSTQRDPLPSDAELEQMNKAELTELAAARKVELENNATKAEIIQALKKG
jgi:hypothetical protein